MVRKYFQKYYTSINDIKEAQTVVDQWVNENVALTAKNDKLAALNQELITEIEYINQTRDHEKKLHEK